MIPNPRSLTDFSLNVVLSDVFSAKATIHTGFSYLAFTLKVQLHLLLVFFSLTMARQVTTPDQVALYGQHPGHARNILYQQWQATVAIAFLKILRKRA